MANVTFQDLKLNTPLYNALDDLGFTHPTEIQEKAFNPILSGKDLVGIAQTGTGKTFAYMLPLLKELKFSKQVNPRILVIVPTRELVVQIVEETEKLAAYINVRIKGVYGGVNMNTHAQDVMQGADIIIATPGRLYDLILSRALKVKSIQKVVIDEVDVMLDLGFRYQLINIFDLLPTRRQNIMFSATMTTEVKAFIDDFFLMPEHIAVAASGAPLENIQQEAYQVANFYTKINLLIHFLKDKEQLQKVLIFAGTKRYADILFEQLEEQFPEQGAVIHSNKTQNYRLRSIEAFDEGKKRYLISSDITARGLDFNEVSHVISLNVPEFPENYIHRIGRTGRAEKEGHAIVFYTEEEQKYINEIEKLMDIGIAVKPFPDAVEISDKLLPEEQPEFGEPLFDEVHEEKQPEVHEKKAKNKKVNLGGSYRRELAKKYKKPKTRGDKNFNKKNKKRKKR
ncbi:DEAD/DEAH box helicase [Zhouia sp. PK063]|uniref:DEAD/DEAH box helicase n=1 Tax=Zhouia sp. PK063 TaxID=3373602 RepID=UPI00378DF7CA